MLLDFILGILFLYLLLVGAYRGFIELFIKSVGFGIGLFIAYFYTGFFSKFLSNYFHTSQFVLNLFSFSLILIFFSGVSFFIYRNIKKIIHSKKKLGMMDRLLGATGGALIFVIIAFMIAYHSNSNKLAYELTVGSKIINFMKNTLDEKLNS